MAIVHHIKSGLGLWCLSYIMAVGFIGGENQRSVTSR